MIHHQSYRISTWVFLCCAWMASLSQVDAVYAADRERSVAGQDVQQEGAARADAEGTVSDISASGRDEHCTPVVGTDLIVGDLQSVGLFGNVGDIHAYAVGNSACNIGSAVARWNNALNEHPVMAHAAFRLTQDNENKVHRFEQIGLSWVKHGHSVANLNGCDTCGFSTNCWGLHPTCTDIYDAGDNGNRNFITPRSTVNANTGYFTPWTDPGYSEKDVTLRRLQIHGADLIVGARYFFQGHLVLADDVAADTHNNNASYREVGLTDGVLVIDATLEKQQEQPAVRAWKDVDDVGVDEVDIQIPDEGLFILAAKAIDLENGSWRYSYALQNLNSDRSAGSFSVPLGLGAQVSNIGFHDVDYHSGEIYDGGDWTSSVVPGSITWNTETFADNENANALRWGTLYNFYFDTNAVPADITITVGLFKPGTPDQVQAQITGPDPLIDCNGNLIPDLCDIRCGRPGGACFVPGCGQSENCNRNGIPDECDIEPGPSEDCNFNAVPDECDITGGYSQDCNENGIPDDCVTTWGDPCEDDCECDNAVYCDGAESCASGDCMPATAVDCSDGVNCTDDSCNEETDACDNTANNANCDNGVYCDGPEWCDPVLDCLDGEDPCPPEQCQEGEFICVNPPELPSDPVHQARKNRYLSINPSTNAPHSVSIKVEVAEMRRCTDDLRRSCLQDSDCPSVCGDDHDVLCPSSEACGGGPCIETGPCVDVAPTNPPLSWLVQAPQRHSNCPSGGPPCEDDDYYARLDAIAVYAESWAGYETLHIGDCQIIPCITYHVYACDPTSALLCSEPLIVATQVKPYTAHYGDTVGMVTPALVFEPPDGFVNIRDISAYTFTSQNWGTANLPQAHPTWIDLHGIGTGLPPNYILDISDLIAVQRALIDAAPWEGALFGGLSPGDCP